MSTLLETMPTTKVGQLARLAMIKEDQATTDAARKRYQALRETLQNEYVRRMATKGKQLI